MEPNAKKVSKTPNYFAEVTRGKISSELTWESHITASGAFTVRAMRKRTCGQGGAK